MTKKTWINTLLPSYLLFIIVWLYGLSLWSQLPKTIAIHFTIATTANSTMPKIAFFGVTLISFILLQSVIFTSLRKNQTIQPLFSHLLTWVLPLSLSFVFMTLIWRNLDQTFPITKFVLLFVFSLLLVIVNYSTKQLQTNRKTLPHRLAHTLALILGLAWLASLIFF